MIPWHQYPHINDTQNQVSMIPTYQYTSINDTQKQISMIPRYQYPSINDTQNQVSTIPRTKYQWYPDTSIQVSMIPRTKYQWYPDTSIQVSLIPRTKYQWYPKESINAQDVGVRTARPIGTAQKPLASLIWHHLDYIRVVSSSLCLKRRPFRWPLALYKSIQPTVKTCEFIIASDKKYPNWTLLLSWCVIVGTCALPTSISCALPTLRLRRHQG